MSRSTTFVLVALAAFATSGCADDPVVELTVSKGVILPIDARDIVGRDDIDGVVWRVTSYPGDEPPWLTPGTGDEATIAEFVGLTGGRHEIECRFSIGETAAARSVVVTVFNDPPTARVNAEPTAPQGMAVIVDGRESSDPNGDELAFEWELESTPDGSAAALSNPSASRTHFTPDVEGRYRIRLTVSDGEATAIDTTNVTVFVSLDDSDTLGLRLGDAVYHEATNRIVWTSPGESAVYVLDPVTKENVEVALGGAVPYDLVASTERDAVLVRTISPDELIEIDLSAPAIARRIAAPFWTEGVGVLGDLAVTLEVFGAGVVTVDLETGAVDGPGPSPFYDGGDRIVVRPNDATAFTTVHDPSDPDLQRLATWDLAVSPPSVRDTVPLGDIKTCAEPIGITDEGDLLFLGDGRVFDLTVEPATEIATVPLACSSSFDHSAARGEYLVVPNQDTRFTVYSDETFVSRGVVGPFTVYFNGRRVGLLIRRAFFSADGEAIYMLMDAGAGENVLLATYALR